MDRLGARGIRGEHDRLQTAVSRRTAFSHRRRCVAAGHGGSARVGRGRHQLAPPGRGARRQPIARVDEGHAAESVLALSYAVRAASFIVLL